MAIQKDIKFDGFYPVRKYSVERYYIAKFEFTGDYEFLLQVCGRKSASATYYCCRCLFAKPNPNSFHNPDACGKGLLRENFEPISTDTGYIQEPLFSNIPPNLIIMPCLHIFMGIVTMLITLLEESLKREDFKKLTTEQREEIENNLKTADTEIVAMENKLNKNKTIILEAEKNWEMLQDIKKSNEAISSLSSNKGQRNRCQMDYCAKRAGYPIDDNIRSCSCCQRAKNYHEFCIGSHAASKSITCSGLQKYQQKGGLLAEIPKLMTKLKKDIDKSKSLVQSLTAKIEYSIVQKYEASGDNMKQYADILDEMRISKRVWYQTFVGNHIHKLLLNADKFEKLDCLTESRDLQNIILALKLLKEIQHYTQAKFLNESERNGLKGSIENLKLHMQSKLGDVNVTPKFHLLIHHFVDFVNEFKTLGYFNEQGIESLHAEINRIFPRAGFAKNQNGWLMKHQWRRNVLIDITRPTTDEDDEVKNMSHLNSFLVVNFIADK
jgi:hypothetical protein